MFNFGKPTNLGLVVVLYFGVSRDHSQERIRNIAGVSSVIAPERVQILCRL